MKTINTFGCSWTAGIRKLNELDCNWPTVFAHEHKDLYVQNWARAGSNVMLQASILDAFNRTKKTDNDITVFQITTQARLSFWGCHFYYNLDDCFKIIKNFDLVNYQHNTIGSWVDYGNVNVSDISKGYSVFIKANETNKYTVKPVLAEKYYEFLGEEQMMYEWSIAIEYVLKRADFVYFHVQHPDNMWGGDPGRHPCHGLYSHIPCFIDEIGEENYNKWQIDDGRHLSPKGERVLADWVYDKIKDKL